MFSNAIPISKQTQKFCTPFLIICRISGTYPLSTFKDTSKTYLKWSFGYAAYSYIFGLTLAISMYYGLYDDLITSESSTKSLIKKCILCCDVFVTQIFTFCAIYLNTIYIAYHFEFLKCLQDIDKILPLTDTKKSSMESVLMILGLVGCSLGMAATDALMYSNDNKSHLELFLKRYTGFYVAKVVVVVSLYQFWCLSHSILKRMEKLNKLLETYLMRLESLDTISTLKFGSQLQNPLLVNQGSFLQLATAYIKLCDAVISLNKFWGPTIVVVVIGILCSLIKAPLFFLIEVYKPTPQRTILIANALETIYSFIRLTILVEPANSCLSQVQQTHDVLGKLISVKVIMDKYEVELGAFSNSLLHCKMKFVASGLITLDRGVITAIIGAVTTYLVILIQYK